jgi:hypothetical protein
MTQRAASARPVARHVVDTRCESSYLDVNGILGSGEDMTRSFNVCAAMAGGGARRAPIDTVLAGDRAGAAAAAFRLGLRHLVPHAAPDPGAGGRDPKRPLKP